MDMSLPPRIALSTLPLTGRHLYAIITGILLIYYPFGNGVFHAFVPSLITYAFMLVARKQCGRLAWLLDFSYLIGWCDFCRTQCEGFIPSVTPALKLTRRPNISTSASNVPVPEQLFLPVHGSSMVDSVQGCGIEMDESELRSMWVQMREGKKYKASQNGGLQGIDAASWHLQQLLWFGARMMNQGEPSKPL